MVQTKNGDPADNNIVGVTMMIELNEVMVPVGDDNPLPVSGSFSITGGATSANQDTQITAANATNTKLDTVITHVDGIETLLGSQATAAKQDTGNTSVASIDTKTPALGQAAMASSTPVVIASNQSSIPVAATLTAETTKIIGAINNLPATVDTNSGVKSASTIRVVLATDQPALTNKLLVTPDSVALPANQSVNVSQMNGVTVLMGAGNTGTGSQRVTIASDQAALPITTVIPGTAATNLGKAEDAAHASGDTGVMALGVANEAQTTLAADGDYIAQATDTKGNQMNVGNIAHDGVDAGNPIKIGGKASNVEPAAVSASGDRANFYTDMVGRQVVAPYSNNENIVSGAITTAMTATTSTSLVAAPAAGLRNYITTIIVSNSHATVGTDVIIQDGSGGTTLMTIPAAAVYGGAVINLPVPLRQPTTATAIFCANVTTGASTKVSAVGYKGY